ncbi:hypothetical protein [Kineococcus sp. SYSU DK003]|uniref:hypothetical protein n=1 Tax=Kineococcus sp. SYSU DK003 TaxID=3383124 RepID=UPI003D7E94F1
MKRHLFQGFTVLSRAAFVAASPLIPGGNVQAASATLFGDTSAHSVGGSAEGDKMRHMIRKALVTAAATVAVGGLMAAPAQAELDPLLRTP